MSLPKRNTNTMQKRLQKLERRLVMARPELKYCDFKFDAANITTTGTVRFVNFNSLSVGPAEQRIGRVIKCIDWEINFLITSTVDVPTVIRIILAWDRYPDATGTPIPADVLSDLTDATISTKNYDSIPRFQYIKDMHLWTSNAKREYVESYKCKLDGRLTQFAEYDGDDADIVKNALMVLMVSNEATIPPQIAYNSRVRFADS